MLTLCRIQASAGKSSCRLGLPFVTSAEVPVHQIANHRQARSGAGSSVLGFEVTTADTTFLGLRPLGARVGEVFHVRYYI